jgi:hypothetical protein
MHPKKAEGFKAKNKTKNEKCILCDFQEAMNSA